MKGPQDQAKKGNKHISKERDMDWLVASGQDISTDA